MKRIDVHLLAPCRTVLLFHGFGDEGLGTIFVFAISLGHSPVGHGAIRIQRLNTSKGTLRFVVPKPMELADALRKKCLRIGNVRGHRKINLACTTHQIGILTRPLVVGVTMFRMPCQRYIGFVVVLGRAIRFLGTVGGIA